MRCFQARITDDLPNDRLAKYYEQGKARSMAVSLEIDAATNPSIKYWNQNAQTMAISTPQANSDAAMTV